jgi:putative FmdB family regulatory protein
MPIYEYACTACDHRADILHGINDPGPNFCPSCGQEGTMKKVFAPPAILYKGSGWAKKDRAATATKAAKKADAKSETDSGSGEASGSDKPKSGPTKDGGSSTTSSSSSDG